MKIILYTPQIPQNTGNIVRTCSVTNTELILVKPLGFSTSKRQLKRAGLDYWNDVDIKEIDDLEKYLSTLVDPFYFFSSKAKKIYSDERFEKNSVLIFGSETDGLPDELHKKYSDKFLKIPMKHSSRCLNLSNSVSIALYEAYRQSNFSF